MIQRAASGRPRALFLAPVEPWCRENGSSLIIADLLEGLMATKAVDLLPIFLRRPPRDCRSGVKSGFPGIQLGLQGLPRWLSIAKAIILRSSPIRIRFDNRRVEALVLEELRKADFVPSVVHVEHLPLIDIGAHLAQVFACPLVYRSHNIEAHLLGQRFGAAKGLGSTLLRYMSRAEANAVALCNLTLCISSEDLEWVRRHAPSSATELLPCSLLLERYDALAVNERRPDPTIAFAGGLEWPPNENGLRWFVERVLPTVLEAVPHARFEVLARGASERSWLTSNPAVRILDHQSDARALFATSWVSIAPLLQGGGVRIKIPESLALGCPVVATTIGAEGHDLPGLTRADDAALFAQACIAGLGAPPNDERRATLRTAVNARHGATVHAERLVRLWSEQVAAIGACG